MLSSLGHGTVRLRSTAFRGGRKIPVPDVSIWLIAFIARITPVLLGAGLLGYGRYDDGVYFTASDSLAHGRVPYRDFVLLHPPGIMLALLPFAEVGRLIGDPRAFAAARVAWMAIGATNALLVSRLAGRWSRTAGWSAGLIYALAFPSVYSEQSTLLEPVGDLLVLIALLCLVKRSRPVRVRDDVIAGVSLGLATGVKIWYVIPWLIIVCWQAVVRRWRPGLTIGGCGTVALAVLVAPFAALARSAMFDMVVREQLIRPNTPTPHRSRLASIFGIQPFITSHIDQAGELALVVVAVVIVWLVITDAPVRIIAVLFGVNLLVLMQGPAYFAHYGSFTATPLAVILGVAFARLVQSARRKRAWLAVPVVLAVALFASGIALASKGEGDEFPGSALAAQAPAGCVVSDEPAALILMNRLSKDLQDGCSVDVDVTGLTYGKYRLVGPGNTMISRSRNIRWQHYLVQYLRSGSTFVVARRLGDGLSTASKARLALSPALAVVHGFTLRRGTGG